MKNAKYLIYPLLLMLLATFIFPSCKGVKSGQKVEKGTYRAAFYNVENLFDTINLEGKRDDEYTPEGQKNHNTERYFDKLTKLSKVVEAMEYPSLLGVCEVENENVLTDFANQTSLKNHNYQIVHFESPDERGIDNGFLYKAKDFRVDSSGFIRIDFPKEITKKDFTRDILYVRGKLANGPVLHIFINHWPSRRGGIEKSEPKRVFVANELRKAVDVIFAKSMDANILIMGDMNDEPDRKSVAETLGAKTNLNTIEAKSLYNQTAEFHRNKKGSYNYRGNWNMIDNIIVSTSMVQPDSKIFATNPTIFQKDWMMYQDPKNGPVPSKSYGRTDYYGGYSDHLPVYIDIIVK